MSENVRHHLQAESICNINADTEKLSSPPSGSFLSKMVMRTAKGIFWIHFSLPSSMFNFEKIVRIFWKNKRNKKLVSQVKALYTQNIIIMIQKDRKRMWIYKAFKNKDVLKLRTFFSSLIYSAAVFCFSLFCVNE